ncbi:composite domain of metallo-dependent hydrolase [Dichomitus squalens LYAD-421 SS1]|uniref:Composite domain of metallo-dependent hydrolase n=1 Tax=Dichomitus squalens (strain LYAD-421) TaxID=732165 RepID=R7T2Z2_DICSQ|nr:composite domain of metallo-dependent hydrolase [Dichomitus squalens LYAD-421 SS1]EJF62302.1 composite domain of metallo-dependent hydrolase [Dichomitus squalens LYAD-421 SS1]
MAGRDKRPTPPPLTTNPIHLESNLATPRWARSNLSQAWRHKRLPHRALAILLAALRLSPDVVEDVLSRCAARDAAPRSPDNLLARSTNDRFEAGTRATLIKNVTLWTGARNGTEVVYGDIFLDKGLVQGIGYIPEWDYSKHNTDVVDANGSWVTPGLVDLHSHVGLVSAPVTAGALELDSPNGPVLPWLRSIDALNTHDASFAHAIAGGVTTVQVLPDSGHNAIGGQAFMIKLRKTSLRTPTSMIVEPPPTLNGSRRDPYDPRWRHLMMACGEGTRAYGNRMDNIWALRAAFAVARGFRDAQDAFCSRVEAGGWDETEGQGQAQTQTQAYPEDYRWEALVEVLRGRVKVSVQCNEAVDLDAMVRLSQEFKIPIASVHGALEGYLIPQILKGTYAGPPTIALSVDSSRAKREAYRGSEFAPRILAENGLPIAMKSEYPARNGRNLVYEAQLAHYYGLPPNMALTSVTAIPAFAAGLSHRIGILREGADADLVLWDSHPLQLGATPRKVWIDGILQVDADRARVPVNKLKEDPAMQEAPKVPNFDAEREKAVRFDGLAPMRPNSTIGGRVVFQNVKELFTRERGDYAHFGLDGYEGLMNVVVERGRVTCIGNVCEGENADMVVDLHGGALVPGMMHFGPGLGVEEIEGEPSTGDGVRFDPLKANVPEVMGDVGALVRVSDALQFGTRNALVAHHAGVTYATTSFLRPASYARGSFMGGLSATFRTGASNALDRAALIKPATALHVAVGRSLPLAPSPGPSVSTEIATLRRLLLNGEGEHTETGKWFKKAANGEIPLVIDVSNADIMATLIRLKNEVEEKRGSYMRMIFSRATEASLLADEIARNKIGVIISPSRQFPWSWDERRVLPGPPLANHTALSALLKSGVIVGIGSWDTSYTQGIRFDLGWAVLESGGQIKKKQAYELMTTNLEKLLDLEGRVGEMGELVAYDGGSALDFSSKPVAIVAPARGLVEVL